MKRNVILVGDVMKILSSMPQESIQTVVTSPPYWGLRDYDVPRTVWGGDPKCRHFWGPEFVKGGPARAPGKTTKFGNRRVLKLRAALQKASMGAFCWCGAWRGQLGLEPKPSLYVEHIVDVMRAVKRVLRRDGTVWLNLGDCYSDSGRGSDTNSKLEGSRRNQEESRKVRIRETAITGIRPKNLFLLPHRVAIALQDDGWYVRQDVVWSKPNPMPESVRDRPTRAHEYVFLLSRSERYYYDAEAIKEPVTWNAHSRGAGANKKASLINRPSGWDPALGWQAGHSKKVGRYAQPKQNESFSTAVVSLVSDRNKRSVWTVQTEPFSGAHFATFPQGLVAPCLEAGSSPKACAGCGAPWEREVEVWYENPGNRSGNGQKWKGMGHQPFGTGTRDVRLERKSKTKGWHPSCECFADLPEQDRPTRPCLILDPFMGSGTTALVAVKIQRDFIGIEIKKEYAAMARGRLSPELAQGRLF